METVKKYYKYVLGGILFIGVLYLVVYLATPKPEMSELDKYKLEQLNNEIHLLVESQKKLDSQIESYKKEYADYWKDIIGAEGDFTLTEEKED